MAVYDSSYDFLGDALSFEHDGDALLTGSDYRFLLDASNNETMSPSEDIIPVATTDGFTKNQDIFLVYMGRVFGFLSILAGFYIFYWAWRRKEHVYHRLMMGKWPCRCKRFQRNQTESMSMRTPSILTCCLSV